MALQFSAQIAIYILIGFLVRKRDMVNEEFSRMLGNLLVNIGLPCMIVQSLRSGVAAEQLRRCGAVLLLSLAVLAVSALVGQIAYWAAGQGSCGRLFRFGLMISNFTFMGMPAAELLLGQTGLFYFSVLTVPIRIFYYSTVELLLSPKPAVRGRGWKQAFRSPPIWGVAVGILLAATGIQPPDLVDAVLRGLGGLCSPLGMILCGLTIGGTEIRGLPKPRWLILPFLRLMVMPAIMFAFVYALPLVPLIKKAAVLYAALPCAGMMTTYAVRYDPDPAAAAESSVYVLLTSLLSIVTLPLWGQIITYL